MTEGVLTTMADRPGWTFLTNHAHVLLCVSLDSGARVRDVAESVGITERAVLRILRELEEAGYLTRERTGRRNRYRIHEQAPLRHRGASHRSIGDVLTVLQRRRRRSTGSR